MGRGIRLLGLAAIVCVLQTTNCYILSSNDEIGYNSTSFSLYKKLPLGISNTIADVGSASTAPLRTFGFRIKRDETGRQQGRSRTSSSRTRTSSSSRNPTRKRPTTGQQSQCRPGTSSSSRRTGSATRRTSSSNRRTSSSSRRTSSSTRRTSSSNRRRPSSTNCQNEETEGTEEVVEEEENIRCRRGSDNKHGGLCGKKVNTAPKPKVADVPKPDASNQALGLKDYTEKRDLMNNKYLLGPPKIDNKLIWPIKVGMSVKDIQLASTVNKATIFGKNFGKFMSAEPKEEEKHRIDIVTQVKILKGMRDVSTDAITTNLMKHIFKGKGKTEIKNEVTMNSISGLHDISGLLKSKVIGGKVTNFKNFGPGYIVEIEGLQVELPPDSTVYSKHKTTVVIGVDPTVQIALMATAINSYDSFKQERHENGEENPDGDWVATIPVGQKALGISIFVATDNKGYVKTAYFKIDRNH